MIKKLPQKGKWGINRNPLFCPNCELKVPSVRIPKNLREFLWGGHTCSKCQCEFDKYGNKI